MKSTGSTRHPVALLLALLALVGTVAGCDNTPVTPSSPAYSQTDLRVGTGAEAVAGSTIVVTYTGWFYDVNKTDKKGLVFDTSAGRGPLALPLGAGSVIPCWDAGLVGMKVGGARRLVCPPSTGYGSARYVSIPPNATLIFDIELVRISETPTVTAINPTAGTTAGGTAVTITGTGFTSGVSVTFGATLATNVTVVNATTITATTPAHAAGSVDVVVTNTEALSGTLTSGFTFVAPATTVTAGAGIR